jgi:molecular chaperone DnaK
MASDNKSLGRFVLDGIPPAPRGLPQVEVTFDVDANGILSVKAKDKATGKEQSIRIEARSGLTETDIEKMRKDAEANAEADQKKRELAEARNTAEQAVYGARKALSDNKDKIPAELQKSIEEKVAAVEAKKGSDDSAAIKTVLEDLTRELSKVYEAIQKAAPSAGSGQTDGPQEPPPPGTQSAPGEEPKQ